MKIKRESCQTSFEVIQSCIRRNELLPYLLFAVESIFAAV